MEVTYRSLGPAEFRAAIQELVGVYAAAMNVSDRALPGRQSIMERHAASPEFRGLTALADGRLAGFTYGFHGENGQWWHDMVAAALAARAGTAVSTAGSAGQGTPGAWLDDSFEVAELHVLPRWQGRGIGRSLLLSLAAGRPERTAVLSTADAPTRARRLYRGLGFTDLLTDFRFSGSEPPYAVMGAVLPLSADDRLPRSARPSSR
ncbi:MAG TPA: GNAT family N-acetyltransferase [Trebonia sp.]|nr:GNAT family N-acetyltransferase [Trebonia sp.]